MYTSRAKEAAWFGFVIDLFLLYACVCIKNVRKPRQGQSSICVYIVPRTGLAQACKRTETLPRYKIPPNVYGIRTYRRRPCRRCANVLRSCRTCRQPLLWGQSRIAQNRNHLDTPHDRDAKNYQVAVSLGSLQSRSIGSSLYFPQDRVCGHVPNALRASRGM